MLKTLVHELNFSGIRWWLTSGSLLGAVRDGETCKGDTDIDIAMYFEDAWAIKTLNIEHSIVKMFNGQTSYWTVPNGNLPINIQCFFRIGDYRYYCEDDWMQDRLPQDVKLDKKMFNGVQCNIPIIYGQMFHEWFTDWQTPSSEIGQTKIYKIKFDRWENKWEDQKPH